MPAASVRHSSAVSCSSFCCATTAAADATPAIQTARVDRTMRRATPVLIVMITAAAVNASSSDEPVSSAMSDDREAMTSVSSARAQPAGTSPKSLGKTLWSPLQTLVGLGHCERLARRRIAGSATYGAEGGRRSALGERERERDPRAAFVGHGADAAVVGHDDFLHERKAKTGATRLGREEGTEHPLRD